MRWMTCYWFDHRVRVEDAPTAAFSLHWFQSLEIFLGVRCHLCGVASQHALLCDFGPPSLSIEFETQEESAMFYVCPLIHFYTTRMRHLLGIDSNFCVQINFFTIRGRVDGLS